MNRKKDFRRQLVEELKELLVDVSCRHIDLDCAESRLRVLTRAVERHNDVILDAYEEQLKAASAFSAPCWPFALNGKSTP